MSRWKFFIVNNEKWTEPLVSLGKMKPMNLELTNVEVSYKRICSDVTQGHGNRHGAMVCLCKLLYLGLQWTDPLYF